MPAPHSCPDPGQLLCGETLVQWTGLAWLPTVCREPLPGSLDHLSVTCVPQMGADLPEAPVREWTTAPTWLLEVFPPGSAPCCSLRGPQGCGAGERSVRGVGQRARRGLPGQQLALRGEGPSAQRISPACWLKGIQEGAEGGSRPWPCGRPGSL